MAGNVAQAVRRFLADADARPARAARSRRGRPGAPADDFTDWLPTGEARSRAILSLVELLLIAHELVQRHHEGLILVRIYGQTDSTIVGKPQRLVDF